MEADAVHWTSKNDSFFGAVGDTISADRWYLT